MIAGNMTIDTMCTSLPVVVAKPLKKTSPISQIITAVESQNRNVENRDTSAKLCRSVRKIKMAKATARPRSVAIEPRRTVSTASPKLPPKIHNAESRENPDVYRENQISPSSRKECILGLVADCYHTMVCDVEDGENY